MVRKRYNKQGFFMGGHRHEPIGRPDVEPDTVIEEVELPKKIKKVSKKFKKTTSVALITPWSK